MACRSQRELTSEGAACGTGAYYKARHETVHCRIAVEGREYLIFANEYRATGEMGTSSCSRDHETTDSSDEDLAWMRTYPTADETVSIFGSVFMRDGMQSLGEQIPPVSLSIAGEGVTKPVAVDHARAWRNAAARSVRLRR